MRDPIEVIAICLMSVMAWSGAYALALIPLGLALAFTVDRAVTK